MTIRRSGVEWPADPRPDEQRAGPLPDERPADPGPDGRAPVPPPVAVGPEESSRWSWPVPVHVVQALLRLRAALPADDPRHSEIRRHVVELCLPVAHRVARWFRYNGLSQDDLFQVASLGLVQAFNRYDARLGCEFLGFAVPTMCGELRHYLRDRAWTLRVPRAVQETRHTVLRCQEELTQRLRREPAAADVAAHLDLSEAQVIDADLASSARRPQSLNCRVGVDGRIELGDLLGERDAEFERIEYRLTLWKLMAELPGPDRELIAMRFFGDLSQAEIGRRIGISQMHVSRRLKRVLATLRRGLLEDA
jgi:RNA polymerase sigma-B factor